MTNSFDLTDDIETRVRALADKSGQSREAQLRQIIEQGLEDFEDYYAGHEVAGRIARGEEKVLKSEDFWRGLDH